MRKVLQRPQELRLHRRGTLEDGTTVDFGIHGPIKAHYGLDSQPNLPLPVDYLVAAAAG